MSEPSYSEIDRTSPIPYYFQLSELLEQEITHGRWKPDQRLPSEADLCQMFQLSRTTVRQALARIEQEGLIRRDKGRGSFVTDSRRRSWLLQSTGGLFEDETSRLGRSVTSSVLRRVRGPLPRWASDALGLPAGSEGLLLERLRQVDGKVALYVENYLPAYFDQALSSMTSPSGSLYQHLRATMGVVITGARRSLEAVPAGERLGALLQVPPSAPVVAIHSVAWGPDGLAVDCYRAWVRTDRLTIEIEVGSASGLEGDVAEAGGRPGRYLVDGSAPRAGVLDRTQHGDSRRQRSGR